MNFCFNRVLFCAGIALFGSQLSAEEPEKALNFADAPRIDTNQKKLDFGLKYLFEWRHNNNKGQETSTYKPASGITPKGFFNIYANGSFGNDMELKVESRLLNKVGDGATGKCMGTPIKIGYADVKMPHGFYTIFGCQTVHQGGWNNEDMSILKINGDVIGDEPFQSYAPVMEIGNRQVMGALSLQLLSDVKVGNKYNLGEWNNNDSLTAILDWKGDIKGFRPLFQLGTYDNNQSTFINLGLKSKINNFFFTADVMHNEKGRKVAANAIRSKVKYDVSQNFVGGVSYAIGKLTTPYLYYSHYKKKEYSKPLKGNPNPWSEDINKWTDNGTTLSFGTSCDYLSPYYGPYAGFDISSGEFQISTNPVKIAEKTETVFKVGVRGKF